MRMFLRTHNISENIYRQIRAARRLRRTPHTLILPEAVRGNGSFRTTTRRMRL